MRQVRVVICADTESNRKKYSSCLFAAGISVIGETESSHGALRLIQQLQPDVAVIDIDSVPGLSAAAMLEDDGQIGLVLVGSNRPVRPQNVLGSGLLTKPVSGEALAAATEFAAAGQARLCKVSMELAKTRETLETRKLVERAKGMLMEKLGLSESQAYRRLQTQSMNKRVSLKKVAEAIITAHEFAGITK